MNANKTVSIILSIIVGIIVIWGIYYFATHKSPGSVTVNNYPAGQAPGPGTSGQPSMPAVSTKTASFISSSTAVLNGDINPNGVQTSYWYEFGETQALGKSTSRQLIGGGYVTYSAPGTVSGLKPTTVYYYRLTAQNQYGQVFGSTMSFKTTTTPSAQHFPPTVQTKDASEIRSSSVTLNGSVNPSASSTSYWFEYGKNFGLGNATSIGSLSAESGTVTVSAALSALEPDTTYYYRINAQNAYGTVNGNISVFVTQPVNPPVSQGKSPTVATNNATSITASSAVLNGKVNPNGTETTYHFEYGKATLFGLFSLDQSTDNRSAGSGNVLTSFSRSVAGLERDTTYYFQLVAVNKYGTTRGSVYSFTTKP